MQNERHGFTPQGPCPEESVDVEDMDFQKLLETIFVYRKSVNFKITNMAAILEQNGINHVRSV